MLEQGSTQGSSKHRRQERGIGLRCVRRFRARAAWTAGGTGSGSSSAAAGGNDHHRHPITGALTRISIQVGESAIIAPRKVGAQGGGRSLLGRFVNKTPNIGALDTHLVQIRCCENAFHSGPCWHLSVKVGNLNRVKQSQRRFVIRLVKERQSTRAKRPKLSFARLLGMVAGR